MHAVIPLFRRVLEYIAGREFVNNQNVVGQQKSLVSLVSQTTSTNLASQHVRRGDQMSLEDIANNEIVCTRCYAMLVEGVRNSPKISQEYNRRTTVRVVL